MRRSPSRSSSGCSRRCIPAVSTSGSAEPREPIPSPPGRCAGRRRTSEPTTSPSSCTSCSGTSRACSRPAIPYEHIHAVPGRGYRPAIWLLGSSTYSAQAAGILGMPFSFAYHFAPAALMDALDAYRSAFRPSAELDAPYVMLGVSVVVAESESSAPAGWPARVRSRSSGFAPGVPTCTRRPKRPRSTTSPRPRRTSSPSGLRPTSSASQMPSAGGSTSWSARTGVDELMVSTMVHGHEDRVRSYQMLAEAWSDQ